MAFDVNAVVVDGAVVIIFVAIIVNIFFIFLVDVFIVVLLVVAVIAVYIFVVVGGIVVVVVVFVVVFVVVVFVSFLKCFFLLNHEVFLFLRILTSFWWFVSMTFLSTYTAKLAALLTMEHLSSPFQNIHELVGQSDIKYGTIADSTVHDFFKVDSSSDLKKNIMFYFFKVLNISQSISLLSLEHQSI